MTTDRTTDRTAELLRLMSLMTGDEKHSAAATSTLDVLRVLYERVLDVSPDAAGDPHRDRFYLSKGHGPMAYYAVLVDRGSADRLLAELELTDSLQDAPGRGDDLRPDTVAGQQNYAGNASGRAHADRVRAETLSRT